MAKGGTFANGGGLDDAKIYVADLAEYNNGRLVGKWLDLSDYSSGAEVMEAIQEMLDEQTKKDKYGDVHEEYAIHDFEGFPSSFYHESMGESDFDALYEMMRVADSSNLPLEVLMEAVSDLGYEDDPERVAEAYYSSVPASMGNEWRDFAYEYIDSIGSIKDAVSNPDYYFDFESFGSDVRMDYTDEELEEMGYNDLSDEELGEQMADELGGVKNLGEKLIETYFDYDKFGRELEYDFISVRGKDGDYYFFNRNFAKGGKVKNRKEVDVKNTRYRVIVSNTSSNDNRQGTYFIEASSKERAEEIALEKFKKEFGTRRGISIYVDSIKEVPMQDGKERTRKYFVRIRNSKGSEVDDFIIDAFDETTASRRAFAMFRKKYGRPSAYNDDTEVFFSVIDRIYPIDEIKEKGVTTYRRTFAKGGEFGNKMNREEMIAYEKSNHIHYNPMNSRWEVMKDSKSKEFLNQEQAEKFAGFEFDDEKDSRYSRAKYEALFGYAKGGKTSYQKIYEVEYEIGGKKHTSQFLMYDSDRVENLLPPATKIISIKEKYAKGGTLEVRGDSLDEIKKQAKLISKNWKKNIYVLETTSRNFTTNNKTRKYTWGADEDVNYIKSITHDMRENITILMRYNNGNLMSAEEEIIYKSPSLQNFDESKYAKGGKIGFEGLAKKVAKRYVGKKVSKEYQAEYGKTYDAKEAKEVGNKVAGKVYQQQVAKKKIVRKLQRKSK